MTSIDSNSTVSFQLSTFGNVSVGYSIDTMIARSCDQFFKATKTNGQVVGVNIDFVDHIAIRADTAAYVYFSHTPIRFDVLESIDTLVARMNLCSAGGGAGGPQNLYTENDSLKITDGTGGIPIEDLLGAAQIYTAGAGIQFVNDTVITNIGDTDPNDDLLKTTVHSGDVTGLYNALVIGDSVIGWNNLDQVIIDSILNGGVYYPGDGIAFSNDTIHNTGDLDPDDDVLKTTNHEGDVTGVYNMLEIADSVISWVNLDQSVIDSILSTDGLGDGEHGQTLYWDSIYGQWTPSSNLYSDSIRVSINGEYWDNAALTVTGDTMAVFRTDTAVQFMMFNEFDDINRVDFSSPGEDVMLFHPVGVGSMPCDDCGDPYPGVAGSLVLHSLAGRAIGTFETMDVGITNSFTHTSGTKNSLNIGTNQYTGNNTYFNPTTGSGVWNALRIGGIINQTGASSGISRSIYVNPTQTSVKDYRGVEVNATTGVGFMQQGANMTNRFIGKTIIGSLITPARDLHVEGRARITGSVGGADGLLGVKLSGSTKGDITHVILGDGFTITSDTATATLSVEGWDVSDGMLTTNISGETVTFVGINGATVTLDTSTNTIEFDGNGGGGGPAGENNVGLNLGDGAEVYKSKSDTTFLFRTLIADGILTADQNDTTIILTAIEIDGDSTNELQVIDTFDFSSRYLRISLSEEDSLHTVQLDSLFGFYASGDTGLGYVFANDTINFVGTGGIDADYDDATQTLTIDGSGIGIGPGTVNTYPIFTSATTIGDGRISQAGSQLWFNSNGSGVAEAQITYGSSSSWYMGLNGFSQNALLYGSNTTSFYGLTWASDTNTGISHNASADSLRIDAGGNTLMNFGTSGTTVQSAIKLTDFTPAPSKIAGLSSTGLLTDIVLGDGLSFSNDTLAAGGAALTYWTESGWYPTDSSSAWTPKAGTNINAVIQPLGTAGVIFGPGPDGTTVGGNARGQYCLDLQPKRLFANEVVSGDYGVAVGNENRVSASFSNTVGYSNEVTATFSGAYGLQNTVSAQAANAIGYLNTASGYGSLATGEYSKAGLYGERRHQATTTNTSRATSDIRLWRVITGTSATELFLDGASIRAILNSNTSWSAKVQVVATTTLAGNGSGAVGDTYIGEYVVGIKRVTNSTALVGNGVVTTVTSVDAGMAGSTATITADDVNEALKITFTPPTVAGSTTQTTVTATVYFTEISW